MMLTPLLDSAAKAQSAVLRSAGLRDLPRASGARFGRQRQDGAQGLFATARRKEIGLRLKAGRGSWLAFLRSGGGEFLFPLSSTAGRQVRARKSKSSHSAARGAGSFCLVHLGANFRNGGGVYGAGHLVSSLPDAYKIGPLALAVNRVQS